MRARRIVLLSSLAAVAGCHGEAARRPGDVVVLVESAPESLDRRFTLSVAAQRVASLVTPGLIRIGDGGEPVPDLAESFEAVDPATWRFVLRPGLTFHDGSPVTPHDVAATLESLKDPALGSPLAPKLEKIRSATAIDDRTVDVHLTEPFSPAILELNMGILPARLVGPAALDELARRPIGAGPFRFVERPDEERVVLAPFAAWHAGAPLVQRVTFRVVRDETTRVLALLHGDADLVQNAISPVMLRRLEAEGDLTVERRPGAAFAYMGFNVRHPVLADARVRRAFALALDREAIARHKFHGVARPTPSMLPAGHWARHDVGDLPHDPGRARALLDEAGWPDPDGDGPVPRFTVTYKTSTDRFRKSVALALASQLREVGIGVELQSYEWATFFDDVKRGRFEIMTLIWTPVVEPHLMHWAFATASIPSEGNGWRGGNRGGYANAELDRLLDAAARETDRGVRRELYARVQEILARDLPYVFLWHEDTVAVASTRLVDYEPSPFGDYRGLERARLR
jgi:peptide/nickel transport system substrate-binding protein